MAHKRHVQHRMQQIKQNTCARHNSQPRGKETHVNLQWLKNGTMRGQHADEKIDTPKQKITNARNTQCNKSKQNTCAIHNFRPRDEETHVGRRKIFTSHLRRRFFPFSASASCIWICSSFFCSTHAGLRGVSGKYSLYASTPTPRAQYSCLVQPGS